MIKIIIGVVIATIIGLVVLGAVESGQTDSGGLLADGLVVEDGETVQVSIAGEVNREGTYLIDSGSTLGDLILAAGSATGNADPSAYDVNCPIGERRSFYIAPLYDNSDICATEPIEKTCINTDDKGRLREIVSAFSDTVAQAIVDYRNANGDFQCIEELDDVKGIGPATFEKCKDLVTLR